MAKKKTKLKTLEKSGETYKGEDSTKIIDVIKVYGKGNTVKARKGDDQITVYKGDKHKIYGDAGVDKIVIKKGNSHKVYGGDGNDEITVNKGKKSYIYGGAGKDKITVKDGASLRIYGDSGKDVIRIKGGSGHIVDGGTSKDKIYVDGGSVKSIDNSGGDDYIEIGKNAGNGIKVESGASKGYKLNANETVKVLGGSNHDIRLYGGNDKVIIAGGSGHTVYSDGPTGTGDGAGDDIIVIQDGGVAKKIVAGNGNDVIAVANGAGNGSVIYTGLEDHSGKNSGTGHNTLNLLGGSGHTVYLGGEKNIVMVEAQNVTLNKFAGTDDDITVRWSEDGIGTLRINCPNEGSGGQNSMLRLEGVKSTDFSYEINTVQVKTGNAYDGYAASSLVMKFTGSYTRDTRNVNTVTGTPGTVYYQYPSRNEPNDVDCTGMPVYINTDGRVQYNWCQGNERFVYDATPTVTAEEMTAATGATPTLEIARWGTFKAFVGITFDDGVKSFAEINTVANSTAHRFV